MFHLNTKYHLSNDFSTKEYLDGLDTDNVMIKELIFTDYNTR